MAISPLTLLFTAVNNASPTIKQLIGDIKGNFNEVGRLAQSYNEIQGTIQGFANKGREAYKLLIGQNVELQGQLLATQASIVATNKVIANGVEIKDPTAAIKALKQPTDEAIAALRKGSLDLVGVTSNQLVPIFQLVAQESSSVGANLKQSADLTLSVAAAMGTLQIPLFQANEEVRSLMQGTITVNSRLAKSLGINNEMVNKWKAQGVFVDRITEKLAAFRAGNALAARTIDGTTSNLTELLETIARVAGEPLLDPIVTQLNNLYEYLKANQDQLQAVAQDVVNFFLSIGTQLSQVFVILKPVFDTLSEALFTQLSAEASITKSVIQTLTTTFINLVTAATPLLQILADILLQISKFANSPLGKFLIETGIYLALFTQALGAASAAVAAFKAAMTLTSLTSFLSTFPTMVTAMNAFSVATALGSTNLQAFAYAASAAITPLLPLIALGGAIALTVMVKKIGDLKSVNDEQEEYYHQIDNSADAANRLVTELKALNDLEIANGKLTKDQEARRRQLLVGVKGQIEGNKMLLESVKAVQASGDEYATQTQKTQITNTEKIIEQLQKYSGQITTQKLDLQNLGDIYSQLGAKVQIALDNFKKPATEDIFKQSIKEITDLTNQQLQLGAISSADAKSRFQMILDDNRTEFTARLAAIQEITKVTQRETDKRVRVYEDGQTEIQSLISNEEKSQAQGQREITILKIEQLKIQVQAVEAAIKTEEKLREEQTKKQIEKLNQDIAEAQKRKADAQNKVNAKSDVPVNLKNIRLADQEIKELEAKKVVAANSLKVDSDTQIQLKQQRSKFNADISQTQSQLRKIERDEALKNYDEQQQIVSAYYENGKISQEDFNQRTYQLTVDRIKTEAGILDERQKKLDEYQKRTGAKDKEGQEEIAAARAALSKKLVDAQVKLQDDQLRTLELKQKEAYNLVTLSEAQRAEAISKFRLKQPLEVATANQMETESNRQKIQDELKLEQDKLKLLQSQEKIGNEAREKERQSKISDSNVKIAQLTKSLVDNEIQMRQRTFEVFEENIKQEIAQRQNATEEANQGFEREKQLQDALNQSAQIQNSLLEVKKGLVSSISDFYQSELNILKETATTDQEKSQIAKTTADIRLAAVREQARIEREILNLNLQQKQAALDMEALELKQKKVQARSETLTAESELKILEKNPNATDEQKLWCL